MTVLIARLFQTRLIRIYRWFGLYVLLDLVEALLLLRLQQTHAWRLYAEAYMAGQGLKMILSVFVLLELYRVALATRPAIARFGQKTVGYALAVAATIAVLGVTLDRSVPKDQPLLLHRYFTIERTMDIWGLTFLLLITGFMLWFPVKLMRNAAFYLLGFMVYFSARSAGLLVMNLLPHRFTPAVDSVMLGVSCCCLTFWAIALRSRNEDQSTVLVHRSDASALALLEKQLDAINASLLRLSRR
jgi:hypothetical protein